MAKKEIKKEEELQQEVGEALSTTGQWIEDNSNLLTWIITGIVVVVLGVIAINNYVIKPKAAEASAENAKSVVYFQSGDFEKALNGDEAECIGFAQTADNYRMYSTGKLAALYAGICYYQLGDYEQAANYLKRFKANDVNIGPAANQMLGDAYVELQEYGKAIRAFEAAANSENDLIAPMSLKKAGIVYLEMGDKRSAKHAFETIKEKYPVSQEASDIDKYIEIAQ